MICISTSEAAAYTFLFPFVPFMVKSFGVEEEDVGLYSGWIASSFMLGQLFSSFLWGWASDRIGIRPVMLFGLACTIICTILFGFASDLAQAITARFVLGILNGNVGVVKTFIGLITDESNEAEAFGYMALCWGFGSIIGPTVGGLLAQPATKYSSVFTEGSIFATFPFLLPCLATAVIPAVGLCVGLRYLPEPHRAGAHARTPAAADGATGRKSERESGTELGCLPLMEAAAADNAALYGADDDEAVASGPPASAGTGAGVESTSLHGGEQMPAAGPATLALNGKEDAATQRCFAAGATAHGRSADSSAERASGPGQPWWRRGNARSFQVPFPPFLSPPPGLPAADGSPEGARRNRRRRGPAPRARGPLHRQARSFPAARFRPHPRCGPPRKPSQRRVGCQRLGEKGLAAAAAPPRLSRRVRALGLRPVPHRAGPAACAARNSAATRRLRAGWRSFFAVVAFVYTCPRECCLRACL